MHGPNPRLARILLVIAVFAVYLPLVGGGFVWDDHLLIVQNGLTDSLANIPAMFTTDLWGATPVPEPEPGYYRPLMLVDLAITRAFVGLNHRMHHLHNLMWHGAAILLLLVLLELIVKDRLAAILGASLFALHPVQIEVVGFVSARNDPMAVTWLLAALLLLSAKTPSKPALLGGVLCACAAMLCKESVLFAPLLLAFACRGRWGGWGTPASHIAVLVGFGIAFLLRLNAGVGVPAQADWPHLGAVGMPALAFYLDKLIWPVDIAPVIHFGWLPEVPWTTAGMALVLLGAMAYVFGPFARVGLLFALLGLLPAWAAIAHVGAVVDRYMYLPMVGISWAVAAGAQRPLVRTLTILALCGCTLASMRQVPIWKNEATLWKASMERAPSGYAAGALARWLEDNGETADAAHWYGEAVQPPRPFHEACFNISRVHLKLDRPDRAVTEGRAAIEAGCEPSPELLAPLALALALEGEWEEAEVLANEIGRDPTGKAVIVRLAARVRAGDRAPLEQAMGRAAPADAVMLERHVLRVLAHARGAEALDTPTGDEAVE